jgi:hypothetical protein
MGYRMRAGHCITLEKAKPSALPMPAAESLMASHGRRNWAAMGKERLLAYAKEFIAERGISGRKELEKADRGLYEALSKRKLLDAVFSEAESSRHADAVNGVIGALESFGDGK